MATEVEQLYLQLELINIEEQMLILHMLKRRRQRRRLRRWSVGPAEAEPVNLQHWFTHWGTRMNKRTFHTFECQRAHLTAYTLKTGKSNCRKLRSERTNRFASTWRVVRVFWRCTSGYGVGFHVDAVATPSKWRRSINCALKGTLSFSLFLVFIWSIFAVKQQWEMW